MACLLPESRATRFARFLTSSSDRVMAVTASEVASVIIKTLVSSQDARSITERKMSRYRIIEDFSFSSCCRVCYTGNAGGVPWDDFRAGMRKALAEAFKKSHLFY